MTQTISTLPSAVRIAGKLLSFQRQALLAALAIAILTALLLPIAATKWPAIPAFLPSYQTAIIGAYAIAGYLLYGYFKQTGTHAILYLWGGSVYTAAILLAQFLSVPGAFVPNVRLLGGGQTTSWLWFFWHLGATGMLFCYALAELRAPGRRVADTRAAFLRCLAWTGVIVLVTLAAVTLWEPLLPIVDVAGDFNRITHSGYAPFIQAIIMAALLMLWRATRFKTPISAWIGVAMVALAFDNAITMAGGTRLSVGWYVGRINALLAAMVMLGLYLKEINCVYLRATQHAGLLAQANERLKTEHGRLLSLFEQAPGFVAVLGDDECHLQIVNAAFQRLVGERLLVGLPIRKALPELAGQGWFECIDEVTRSKKPHVASGMTLRLRRGADGGSEERIIDVLFQPNIGPDGELAGVFIQGQDVTEQHRARVELERHQSHLESLVQERTRSLEDTQTALLHAQKLEAIGKLTGGVAHDFNNVLHIINGNVDLIKMLTGANAKVQERCQSAQTAVRRGAKLSAQLLAFARKQPLQPTALKLGEVFAGIDLLLKRAVGERVEMRFAIAEDAWNVEADAQQLENVILNLVLNASDAMPEGGTLDVAVANTLRDGAEFTQLSLRDSGVGMSDEVRARAFEPFFSTKGVGKGTGLGLSMAYGFVTQSGGHIDLDSTPGQGTTVNILLPRTSEAASMRKSESAASVTGGSETILVVDDEAEIRANVAAMLTQLGYTVLSAESADAAAAMLEGPGRIDLLFTDVIMPGAMSSTTLAERARARHPAIRVLFTSGYTENAVIRNGRLEEGVNLLSKPYAREDLARAVRGLLSAPLGKAA
ncbi:MULTISPECIES: MASE4 domain-containing protein [unclassified Massilia]|uniref:MASE4 domain-containing protein n=1 Tax=unclassified Massilia TaxID=2609279 RepID=UPI00177C94AE|nr:MULTISPECIES: MASE4 domain-containing protein [unclassified Massilia]MBD8530956.1 MASE4 domain-containing protein [Massilia sp. CFBP 13647]MBD8674631.1 MASE4 domain-containing protein [Massilia sp. CFBP 13721]